MIVGVSHWLDDLVDGREERGVLASLRTDGEFRFAVNENGKLAKEQQLFDRIYCKEVTKYTDPTVYQAAKAAISGAVPLKNPNLSFMYFGLIRVAAGSVMFSPKIREQDRNHLIQRHNAALRHLVEAHGCPADARQWKEDIVELLGRMDQEDTVGEILLGLTTKTAQELAMSSEASKLDFPLSVLYSLLYAPLLYFHDIDDEMECGEMVSLDSFDVNYDLIMPWLRQIRELCANAPDERTVARLQQIEMAYRCFASGLPSSVKEALAEVYLPGEGPTLQFRSG